MAPVIFQQFIQDKTDVRVTVVGNKVFAVKILSEDGRPVPIDWRTEKEGLAFRPFELPDEISTMCKALVRESGLIFGAIDLVFSDGQYYFLEINPNGEWGWLQTGAKLPIAKAIADVLVSGQRWRQ